MHPAFAFVLPLVLLLRVGATTVFVKKDEYVGEDFLKHWEWQFFEDPTHGRTNYVDQGTAMQRNLSYATGQKFFMSADKTSVVPGSARGRDSIRISSNASYDEALFIIDLAHMPTGCATWPAWWTVSAAGPWPAGGEIDIIEGVNLGTQNLASLHASSGCSMPQNRSQTGVTISTDCDAATNFNQGCGTLFMAPPDAASAATASPERGSSTTQPATVSDSPTPPGQQQPYAAEAAPEPGSQAYSTTSPPVSSEPTPSSLEPCTSVVLPASETWANSSAPAQSAAATSPELAGRASLAPVASSIPWSPYIDNRANLHAARDYAQNTSASSSFGAPFNAAGGGFYAMSKSRAGGVNVWAWSRNAPDVPAEVRSGGPVAVPSVSWGVPAATFPLGDNCAYDKHFDAHRMVFDLTLCGDWAGSAWGASGCGTGTCEDFVNNNPQAFAEAYWEINAVRVYVPATGW